REMGFTLEDLVTVIVQGFKSGFLPYREKSDLLKQVNRDIAETLTRFASKANPPPRPSPLARGEGVVA
ncbi:MAG TPA: hypothetical protein VEM76_19175, partial [Anaeromyxobacteraceae bacterium]|nr:hypothetical protein [Anaeromyxobacteraceae bacterium]